MSTLVQITKEARLILKIGGALAILGIIIFLGFKGGSFIQNTFFPKPAAPPEEKFGKLPNIIFPNQTEPVPSFRINTISGLLPAFPQTLKVYKLKLNAPGITALQSARTRAASLGYSQNQQAVSQTVYRWNKASSNSVLTYNIMSLGFSVSSNYLSNSDIPTGEVANKEAVLRTINNFIDALQTDKSDIDFNNATFSYFVISSGQLVDVFSPESAQVVKIYLAQNPVDNLKIFYPTTNSSLLYFVVAKPSDMEVVEANFNHFTPNLGESSTYPVKSADNAYEDLKSGKGYILSGSQDQIVDITDVALGYYLSDDPNQTYLMPIIVFLGKNNFTAYVSAIDN